MNLNAFSKCDNRIGISSISNRCDRIRFDSGKVNKRRRRRARKKEKLNGRSENKTRRILFPKGFCPMGTHTLTHSHEYMDLGD